MKSENLTKFPFPQNLFYDLYGISYHYTGYTGYRLLRLCNLIFNSDDLFVLMSLYQRNWSKSKIERYLGKSRGYADSALVRTFERLRRSYRRSYIYQLMDGSLESFRYQPYDDYDEVGAPNVPAASNIEIDIFDISGKSFTSLLYAGINNVYDIICTPKDVFKLIPNISRKDFNIIDAKINELGFEYKINIYEFYTKKEQKLC